MNALYACSEIGYDDNPTLLEAGKLLIWLTSIDPAAFSDDEVKFIQTQLNDAEYYATRLFNNPNQG